jgi:predicted molibdopterin-dependent oxidoreductase YjgC
MFRRGGSDAWTIFVDGRPVGAREGDSAASAMLAAGINVTRLTPVSGAPRGPWCMMGACFDCIAIVDGQRGVRTCVTPARDGLRVDTGLWIAR